VKTIKTKILPDSVVYSAPEIWAAVPILVVLPRVDLYLQSAGVRFFGTSPVFTGFFVVGIFLVVAGIASLPRKVSPQTLRITLGSVGGLVILASASVRLHSVEHVPATIFQNYELSAVSGSVLEDLRPGAGEFRRLVIRPKEVYTTAGWRGSAAGRITVLWRGEDTLVAGDRRLMPVRGDRVTVPVNRSWPVADSPIIWTDSEGIELHPVAGLAAVRRSARQWVRRRLARLTPMARSLTVALLLGERQDVPEEVLTRFRRSGAAHVLALSGMHLGVLAAILTAGTGLIVSRNVSRLLILPPMFVYVWIAGWIPSLVRALILVTLVAVARARDRAVPLPLLLARTVVISAVIAPHLVVQVGFRLSILALVGIFLLTPQLTDFLSLLLPRFLAIYGAVTLSAMITTAPLSLSLFGEIYPGGLLFSGVLSFLVILLMWVGLLVLLAATVPFVGTGLVYIASVLTLAVTEVAAWGSRLPGLSAGGAVVVAVAAVVFLGIAGVRFRLINRTVDIHADQPRFDY